VKEAVKQIEVSEQAYYRWRREYGGMKKSQIKQLKALQKENARLKKLLAEKELDIDILKEVAEGKRLSHEIVGRARRAAAGPSSTYRRSWASASGGLAERLDNRAPRSATKAPNRKQTAR
jgi:uncharacterized protein YhaN